jgi:hypothetical protein
VLDALDAGPQFKCTVVATGLDLKEDGKVQLQGRWSFNYKRKEWNFK